MAHAVDSNISNRLSNKWIVLVLLSRPPQEWHGNDQVNDE